MKFSPNVCRFANSRTGHAKWQSLLACILLLVAGFSGCALDRTSNMLDLSNVRFQDRGYPDEPNLVGPNPATSTPAAGLESKQNKDAPLTVDGVQVGDKSQRVAEVRITGNQRLATHQILRHVRTRPGRFFDPDLMQRDVDQLWRHDAIRRVNGPFLERTADGIIVTIDVSERRYVDSVRFVGNRAIGDRKLREETGIEPGEPLDVHSVRMAKQRIIDLYREKGFSRTQVDIVEGSEVDDQNVVFLVHEDQQQKIFRVTFEGNTAASDARLAKFVKSKAGILWVFGGNLDRNKIDQDLHRLTSYYRNLGYFNARIGRELRENNDGSWVTVHYVIDEGPRYRVRNVAFVGNQQYTPDQLTTALKLVPSQSDQPFFNAAEMNQDIQGLVDAYGTQGFVFADVQAETRFLEEPGLIDLVYKIEEGKQYRVGKINVVINGDYGVTKRQVVLNRMGLRPGDLIDTRKLRTAEARLTRSQLFSDGSGSSPGAPPKVAVKPPELGGMGSSQRR